MCGVSPCTQHASINVGGIGLDVQETTPPNFGAPTGLWPTTGWVRGTWPFFAWSNSPSGVCTLTATLNGQLIDRSTSPSQDGASWHQCTEPAINEPVDTTRYGQGPLALTLSATDAAQLSNSTSRTLDVDNQQPAVTLSGPTDAPSTAGTQYVTANATAGPSGVAQISCSVDGAPATSYPGASAQVPVSGIGEHGVTCTATNNAVDGNGFHGVSAPATWGLRIGQPTVAAIGFTRIVDGLRCRHATARRTTPGHWTTVVRNGRRVRTHVRARTRAVRVVRCHARVARRRVLVTEVVRRHGRRVRIRTWRTIRVVLLPHADRRVVRVVRHGQGAIVSGWLGTATGVALGGQTIQILTAPDNGAGALAPATSTTTAADGSWSAHLPAGPGRLIEASYGGAPTTEPTTSSLARLVVPARVELLSVTPNRVAWGGTVRLRGRLAGGYLPAAGALVRLRIGLGRAFTTYGVHEHVTGDGRFTTTYTFGAGQASAYRSFWFQVASLPMGDYPYAPASSRRVYVTVGGHPARPRAGRRHR